MSLQTTLPIGPGGGAPEREIGIGNHRGPTAVAIGANSIFASSGHGETTAGMLRMDMNGTQRISSFHQPDISLGRIALGVMDGQLYGLQNDARIGVQAVESPNWPWSRVGPFPDQPGNLDYVGRSIDVLWPGTARPGPDSWFERSDGLMPMDMAVSDRGGTPQLAVSYLDQNAVQWRNPATGAVLATATVQRPTGVAFDAGGNLLVAGGSSIFRYDRQSRTVSTLATGLADPYRLDVDPATGDIFVAERGASNRVKRLSAQGNLIASYGAPGGRSYGLYNPQNFKAVTDIAATGDGGFIVTEFTAPRRIARYNSTGQLVKEWYAGSTWVPYAAPEPDDPTTVWAGADYGEVARLKVDYSSGTYSVHSIYSVVDAARSIPALADPFGGGGTGLAVWKPRRIGGQLFLARDASNSAQFVVLRVNEENWTLKAAAAGDLNEERALSYLWSDQNGDGEMQAGERRSFGTGWYIYHSRNLRSDENLNYWALNQQQGGMVRIRRTGMNAAGNPVYEDLGSPASMTALRLPQGARNARGEANVYDSAHHLAFGEDGSVYAGLGIGPLGFGQVRSGLVLRWNEPGDPAWALRQSISGSYYDPGHQHQPGRSLWSTFKNAVGVAFGNIVMQDFNGGISEPRFAGAGITYVWDRDGLWVGGLFDNPDLSKVGIRYYRTASESGAGVLYANKQDGSVLYFGGTESATSVFRITGWNGWLHLSGDVSP